MKNICSQHIEKTRSPCGKADPHVNLALYHVYPPVSFPFPLSAIYISFPVKDV